MKSDIVEWLRAYANRTTIIDTKRLDEAAAEIERLRAALELFSCDCIEDKLCKFPHACRNYVARAALEATHDR